MGLQEMQQLGRLHSDLVELYKTEAAKQPAQEVTGA